MRECMYIETHLYTHTYIRVYIYRHTHTHVYRRIYIYIYKGIQKKQLSGKPQTERELDRQKDWLK